MKVDPYTSPLGDVALEILRTVRLDDVTERNLRDLAVGHSHVWADFYGPASSPGLARVLAHRFIDRQGCDELHLRAALVRFGGEQPAIPGDREAELSRLRWKRHHRLNPGPGQYTVAFCAKCDRWTMVCSPDSQNRVVWTRIASEAGDRIEFIDAGKLEETIAGRGSCDGSCSEPSVHVTPKQLANDQTYKTITGPELVRMLGGEPGPTESVEAFDEGCDLISASGREHLSVADRVGLLRQDLLIPPLNGVTENTQARSQDIHDLKLTRVWVQGNIAMYERALERGETEERLAPGADRIFSNIECMVLAWRRGGHAEWGRVRREQLARAESGADREIWDRRRRPR